MKIMELYIAAAPIGDTGETGATNFFKSPFGEAVVKLCGAAAIIIVVISIFRMVSSTSRGRLGDGAKSLLYGLIVGAMLFNLNITLTGVSQMAGLVDKIFSSIGQVTNDDSQNM
jgi:hypothetical protein